MDLKTKVLAYNREIKEALQLIYSSLNHGQQQKLLKNPAVAEMLRRYGVIDEGG